jgi:tetratricopeptide (TPR) repeat protein
MGDRLRINAQLIDGTDGRHVWAERYDGNISEIFEFQDNIREEIVSALQVSLTAANRVLTERKPTSSVEAYDLFLKGRRASYHRDTQETLLEGIKCLEAAIEIDPNFADAYGYLSHCYFYGWTAFFPGFEGALDRAYQLAEKGAMLDRASAIGLMRLGLYQPFLGQYDQIIANFEKAIAIDPNNAEIYATFGMALNYLGDPERALEMSEKALGLEVFSPPLWEFFYAGISYLLLHQYDKALLRFNRMVEQAPKFLGVRLVLACVYVELDRLSDARNAIESALNIVPELNAEKAISRLPFRTEKHRNLILDSVRRAGLPE